MTPANGAAGLGRKPGQSFLFIIDDECFVRREIRADAEILGWTVAEFETCEAFLAAGHPAPAINACLVVDAHLPGMDGLDLFHHLRRIGCDLPLVMISGTSDIAAAVEAMRAGVNDFFECG